VIADLTAVLTSWCDEEVPRLWPRVLSSKVL